MREIWLLEGSYTQIWRMNRSYQCKKWKSNSYWGNGICSAVKARERTQHVQNLWKVHFNWDLVSWEVDHVMRWQKQSEDRLWHVLSEIWTFCKEYRKEISVITDTAPRALYLRILERQVAEIRPKVKAVLSEQSEKGKSRKEKEQKQPQCYDLFLHKSNIWNWKCLLLYESSYFWL